MVVGAEKQGRTKRSIINPNHVFVISVPLIEKRDTHRHENKAEKGLFPGLFYFRKFTNLSSRASDKWSAQSL